MQLIPSRLKHKKQHKQRGFSLVEALIASALLLAASGVAMNFLSDFNRMGNRMSTMATVEERLRSSLNRLEREMVEAAQVLEEHPDDSAITTTKNRVVLGIPLYSEGGFVVVDNDGNPVLDTAVLEVVDDNGAESLRARPGAVKPQRLLFSLTPATDSARVEIENQVIVKDLMPKITTGGTEVGDYAYLAGMTGDAMGTFRYLNQAGEEVEPNGDLSTVSQIKVLLWAEKNEGRSALTSKKEMEVRLRNWGEISP